MPFFKNFYDSGFVEKWFALAGNSLITAAAMVLSTEGSRIAGIFAFISYVCLATLATHGTRGPYEYLKNIYVYPHPDKWHAQVFELLFFIFRFYLITTPMLLVWWAYSSGKVPF